MTATNVTINADGSATVVNAPNLHGAWTVFKLGDAWVAQSGHGAFLKQARCADYRGTYRSRDEALQALGVEVPA